MSKPFITAPGRVTAVEPSAHRDDPERQEYNENLEPNRPAFKDEKEVHTACENYYMQNRHRNERDAYLVDLYFYRPPYEDQKLRDAGLSWAANVPSGFMSAAVSSVTPAFLRAANGAKYLTNARIEGDVKKTELFQSKLTRFIRSWSGWQNLLNCIIQENTLLGRATVRGVDKYDWSPKFYTTQNALFPEQCSQNVDDISQVVFIDQWLPHEFINNIKNQKVAKANGWDIENCVKVLNAATEVDNQKFNDARTLVNWLADGAYVNSYTAKGPVYVETYTMLAVEPDKDGMVSEWVVGRKNGELLYKKENKYASMRDAISVFCFSQGQNTLHSSRGFGRLLQNVHQAYDRNFCKFIDDLFLANMRMVHTTEKRKTDWRITIQNPFIVAPPGVSSSEPMNPQMRVEGVSLLKRELTGLARQIAGAYSPAQILPDETREKTATEATIDASKESELREGILGRFIENLGNMVWFMKRRILDPKTPNDEAKAFQEDLISEGFTKEELAELAEQPDIDQITGYSQAVRNAKIQQFCLAAKGNPAYDQKKLAYLFAEVAVDPEFAKEITLVQPDPAIDAQAVHDQQVETNLILQTAANIGIGPLDNDMIHLKSAMEDTTAFIQGMAQPMSVTKQKLAGLQNLVNHMTLHIKAAQEKGAKPADTKEFERFCKEVVNQIKLFAQHMMQVGQQLAQGMQGGMPQPGQPVAQEESLKKENMVKIIESINFKDLPIDAQNAILENQLGLPTHPPGALGTHEPDTNAPQPVVGTGAPAGVTHFS